MSHPTVYEELYSPTAATPAPDPKPYYPSRLLVSEDDPILREVMPDFDFDNPILDPVELAATLYNVMKTKGGIGLSANQVGLRARVFVMMSNPVLACFNPRIVNVQGEDVRLDEGCLSFPGLFLKIKRPGRVRVRFQTPTGDTVTKVFEGMTARVFQHELDHLDGKVFTDKVSRPALQLGRSKQKKYKRDSTTSR